MRYDNIAARDGQGIGHRSRGHGYSSIDLYSEPVGTLPRSLLSSTYTCIKNRNKNYRQGKNEPYNQNSLYTVLTV
jgi:hypothetical protein